MSWYKIELSEFQVANQENVNLVLQVPVNASLFRKKNKQDFGAETYYIPPKDVRSCAALIERYSGVSCDEPNASEIEQAA